MRKISKPAKAKPANAKAAATKAATPAKAETATTSTVAKTPAHINRTIATVQAGRTNFGGVASDRDGAYLAFYKRLAAVNGGKLTVAQIVASGERPAYNGSNKPHDAGVIVRLTKAGLITGDGSEAKPLTVTNNGATRRA